MRRPAPLLAAAALTVVLAGCNSNAKPPGLTGVCYHVVEDKGGKLRFNEVVRGIPNLENCAARLEALRLRFLGLGGSRSDLVGAYQAKFLFLDRRGVTASNTMTGTRYTALVRTGDGRLAIPGAMPTQ